MTRLVFTACLTLCVLLASIAVLPQRRPVGLFAAPLSHAGEAASACHRPRLILHVGPPKTGSTAIQSFLKKEQLWLEKHLNVGVALMNTTHVKYANLLTHFVSCKLGRSGGCWFASRKIFGKNNGTTVRSEVLLPALNSAAQELLCGILTVTLAPYLFFWAHWVFLLRQLIKFNF